MRIDGLAAPRRPGLFVALRAVQVGEPEREDRFASARTLGRAKRDRAVNRPGARTAAAGSTAEGRTRQYVDQVEEAIRALDRRGREQTGEARGVQSGGGLAGIPAGKAHHGSKAVSRTQLISHVHSGHRPCGITLPGASEQRAAGRRSEWSSHVRDQNDQRQDAAKVTAVGVG
jgi:hypothetical protein